MVLNFFIYIQFIGSPIERCDLNFSFEMCLKTLSKTTISRKLDQTLSATLLDYRNNVAAKKLRYSSGNKRRMSDLRRLHPLLYQDSCLYKFSVFTSLR